MVEVQPLIGILVNSFINIKMIPAVKDNSDNKNPINTINVRSFVEKAENVYSLV